MIGVPSVLTPTVDAMVAVPMLMITDVRTPAIITGAASGSSTFSSRCQALIPIPSATLSTDAGTAAMDILRGPRPMTPYDCQFLRDRLRGKAYLPLAYFEGATPENGYQPCVPYTLNVLADPRPQDIEPGYMRVFLKTAGADSPRPMKLRQKASTGEWFLWEYSSILSGIRIPAAEDPWA